MISVAIIKGARVDRVEVRRANGHCATFDVPKKGPLPHDGVHHAVESVMGLRHAFWGRITAGENPDRIQEIAAAGGHPSASRAGRPDDDIREMLQAERLVECIEAEVWGGVGDLQTFLSVYAAACAQSGVAPLDLTDRQLQLIRSRIAILKAAWSSGRYEFDFG
jgi:hypothetical protein